MKSLSNSIPLKLPPKMFSNWLIEHRKDISLHMPLPALRKMAKESGRSLEDAERYWDDAKEKALEQGFEEGDDDFYAYAMGIVKRRLSLSGLSRVGSSIRVRAERRLNARKRGT